jgi:hypothetical protein
MISYLRVVLVGVELIRELIEGLLDFGVGRVLVHAQDVVGVCEGREAAGDSGSERDVLGEGDELDHYNIIWVIRREEGESGGRMIG